MSSIYGRACSLIIAAVLLSGCSTARVDLNPVELNSAPPTTPTAAKAFDIPRMDSIQIDGKAQDWGDKGFRVDAISSPTGSEVPASDFNVRFRLGWDQRGLLVLLVVHNTAPAESADAVDMWKGDALEFVISTGLGAADHWQAIVAPGMDTTHDQIRTSVHDDRKDATLKATPIQFTVVRTRIEGGYVMETLLPWNTLGIVPKVGQTVGLQIGADAQRRGSDGSQLRLTWFPGLESYRDTKQAYALRLSDHASPPVLMAASSRVSASRHLLVNVITSAELSGKGIRIVAPDGTSATAAIDGQSRPSVTTLQLPLPPPQTAAPISTSPPPVKWANANVVVTVGSQQLDLPAYKNLAVTRAQDFLREKLPVHNFVFTSKTFPAISFERPSEVEDEIGDYHLNTIFYDADFKPVTTADRPGRYGAVVEVITSAGVINRRYQTLYRAPANFDWRGAFIAADAQLARELGIDDTVASEQRQPASEVYRKSLSNSFSTDESLAVLFAGLSESHPGDIGLHYESIGRRNDAWWIALKKSIGQFQPYQTVVHLPPGYSPNGGKHWPLILFLHGSDPHSDNLDVIRSQGLCAYAIAHPDLPFVVISPATPPGAWMSPATLTTLLDEAIKQYDVDPDRVYLTGLSLGGFGTWDLAAQTPDRFAAAVPIAGIGDPNDAQRLKNLPMWVFHGDADPTVPIDADRKCVDALRAIGGRVKFTVYPGVGHDSWTRTYANPELYSWLLEQRRGAPAQAPATRPDLAPATSPFAIRPPGLVP